MGIKTKLKLIGLLPLLMAVVFGITVYRGQERLTELRERALLADATLDDVERLESVLRLFAVTRDDTFRQRAYRLLDSVDGQMLLMRARFDEPAASGHLEDMRRRLVQVRRSFMALDALYSPALTALEIVRLQSLAQRLRHEVGTLKPLLHRLEHESHDALADDSDALWRTEFILIVLTAILVLALLSSVLLRLSTALSRFGQGMRDLGRERFPRPLILSGDDEFAGLARDFNRMAERLAVAEAACEKRAWELENAVKDLESFSYSVSHDLRAPLRAIDGFVAILRDEYASSLDDEGVRLFGVVQDNARKMGGLIDDILSLSRAGQLELELIQVDMNDLVDEVWAGLSEQRGERPIRFRRADLPPVACDPRAMRQVWQNLLGNAVKYTRGRDPALIEVAAQPSEGGIRYSVKDNGVGFDPAYADKLFGLFLRLHGMDEFEGTGVGLAIVKRFIQKHNGRVEGTGSVGVGATFSFTLPI